jgi:hypothetical protein
VLIGCGDEGDEGDGGGLPAATCLTEQAAEPRGAGAGDPVDAVQAGAPVLAGPGGALVHVWRTEDQSQRTAGRPRGEGSGEVGR